MTITAAKFTPEVLLSAPRRSAAVPNPAGTHALYTGKPQPQPDFCVPPSKRPFLPS